MVILANRQRSSNNGPAPTERDTCSVNTRLATKLDSDSFLPAHMRGDMPPDLKRTLSLSLTLTNWIPLPSQGPFLDRTAAFNGLLTTHISGSQSRLIASAPVSSCSARHLTETEVRSNCNSVAQTQHATDRFPRFAYLLRNGTPKPESVEGHLRRSADPGGAQASVATIPDALAQCGIGDETALQSCATASASGTLSPSPAANFSSPSRVPFFTPAPAESLAIAPEDQHLSDSAFCTEAAMANYSATTSPSKGDTRNEQLLSPMRRGADRIGSERITGETQLSHPSQIQASSEFEDGDADEQDGDQQGEDAQTEAQTPTEGQPKKKKTRRAGVAITRARRMHREVRRLAEEEEVNAQRQQPSLLLGIPVQPASPVTPIHASMNAPGRQYQGLPLTGVVSPPPRSFTSPIGGAGHLARPPTGAERQMPTPTIHLHGQLQPQLQGAAHSRGPAYDRILENGDDVVLLRLPGGSGLGQDPGSNIWAYRPEEREQPRGGS